MRKIELTATCVSANSIGFANAVTGSAWTLTAHTTSDMLAHLVAITNNAATDHSAKTVTLIGVGAEGEALMETLHLPTGHATTTSSNYYATLISVTPSASIGADTMSIGWAVNAVSAWQRCSTGVIVFNIGFGCTIVSGSPTYTIQHSFGDGTGFNHATVSSQTSNASGYYSYPIAAMRLLFTSAGGVALHAIQTDA